LTRLNFEVQVSDLAQISGVEFFNRNPDESMSNGFLRILLTSELVETETFTLDDVC
jgi:hypothetical protein